MCLVQERINNPHKLDHCQYLQLSDNTEYNPSRIILDHLHTQHVKYLTKITVCVLKRYSSFIVKALQIVVIKDPVSTINVLLLLLIVAKTKKYIY